MTNKVAYNEPLRILTAVNFHFVASRLEYLFQVVRALSEYPTEAMDIVITTNVAQENLHRQIRQLCEPLLEPFPLGGQKKSLLIESYPNLGDPWMLPWCHKHLIRDVFLKDDSGYSHFIYLEDDILLPFRNFNYFLCYRDRLKTEGLIPSFQRIEFNSYDGNLYYLDQVGVSDFNSRRRVMLDGYEFVNLDYPFHAMFILDRELAREYIGTRSFDRELSKEVRPDFDLAVRSGMGLCFENVPPGFAHRFACPVNPKSLTTPCWSWVYHLPNNYTNNRLKPFGKTRIDQMFDPDSNAVKWCEPSKLSLYSDRLRRHISTLVGR